MKTKIGTVGVDAGMLMVGDPCYFIGKDSSAAKLFPTWKDAINKVFVPNGKCPDRDTPMKVANLGIAISTTYGDGEYDVFLEHYGEGRRRLIVNLD